MDETELLIADHRTFAFELIVIRAYAHLRRVAKAAGIPGLTFHGLRHSHATLLAALGVSPKVTQARLGHTTSRMSQDSYTHICQIGGQIHRSSYGALLLITKPLERSLPPDREALKGPPIEAAGTLSENQYHSV